jgi:hypothetical protein
VPEEALDLFANWDKPLLIPFTQDFKHAIFQPQVTQFQIAELRYSEAGIK